MYNVKLREILILVLVLGNGYLLSLTLQLPYPNINGESKYEIENFPCKGWIQKAYQLFLFATFLCLGIIIQLDVSWFIQKNLIIIQLQKSFVCETLFI